MRDWSNNQFPFYTLPPAQQAQSVATDEKLQTIYREFDSLALDGLSSISTLWAGSGLVKFDASVIDSRPVVLVPLHNAEKEVTDEDEASGDKVDDDEVSDDDEEEESSSEEEALPKSKRKREERPSGRKVKAKVTFAQEPPKSRRRVGNAKKSGSSGASGKVDDDTYDFSKFF